MFPEAGVRMKPRRGNLLAWCNLTPEGHVNPNSLHCGEPVEQGFKYIITKWYRERTVVPRFAIGAAQDGATDGWLQLGGGRVIEITSSILKPEPAAAQE